MNNDQDSIREYYEHINRRRKEAWQLVFEARARDASSEELNKLIDAAIDAGYTGD